MRAEESWEFQRYRHQQLAGTASTTHVYIPRRWTTPWYRLGARIHMALRDLLESFMPPKRMPTGGG